MIYDFTWSIPARPSAVQLRCCCGFKTQEWATFEAAGRELDLHLAACFPTPSMRIMKNCIGLESEKPAK